MTVYIIFFIVLILGAIIVPKQGRDIYLIVIFILFWGIIGLRDISIGFDTQSYIYDLNSQRFNTINEAIKEAREPLYTGLTWILAQLSNNYTVYLMFWALFPAVSIYYICKKELSNSSECLLSMLAIFILGFFSFYIAGIRQTAAMSVCLFGWQFLKENKLLPFLAVVAAAYMFHNSSLLFVLAYSLRFLKVRWHYILVALFFFFLGNVVKIDQMVTISQMLFADRFSAYGTVYESELSNSGFLMQLTLYVICFTQKSKLVAKYESANLLFSLTLVGLAFQSLAGLLAEMARVSMFFSIFFIILLPKAVSCYSVKVRKVFYMMFTLGCLVYLFYLSSANMPPYKFA